MTSNYIYAEMLPSKSGLGGVFEVLSSFKLDIIPAPFNDVTVKIDTGCSVSTIPLGAFRVLRLFCDKLKRDDIKNGTPYQLQDFKRMCEYKEWYCGHYHIDVDMNENFHILYEKIIEVDFDKEK